MKRVLLIGLRSEHIAKLRKEFEGKFHIDALTDQDSHIKIPDPVKYYKILSLLRFTNRSSQRLYGKHKGYQTFQGGMSSIRNTLSNCM